MRSAPADLLRRAAALAACLLVSACSSSRPPVYPERPAPAPPPVVIKEEPPPPSPRTDYGYRAVTDDCNCEEFRVADAGIAILFRARYKMDSGIVTTIELEVRNGSADTVAFDHGTVRVSSRNVAYQYNDKFLPLGDLLVPPGDARAIQLTGRDINEANDWNKIAGERLTVTVRGIRAGARELRQQSVTFVPENPMIGR